MRRTARRPAGVPFPYSEIAVLGLVTLAAYGTWAYSFGVLLDPLLADTGWSESLVTGSFSASAALGGIVALPAGRFLDLLGARRVFLSAAVLSTLGLCVASFATDARVFALASSLGGASLGGLAFYHVTQTVAVRVAPDDGTRAIALLTIFGAFSSVVYLPLAAVLVDGVGWRTTIRVLAGSTGIILVLAAQVVRERLVRPAGPERVAISLRRPEVRRFLMATACAEVAVGIILVYQVPLMVGAGLPLATAASMAGARGGLQILGRVPLTRLLRRWGARSVTRVAYAAVAIGVGVLGLAGEVWIALAFAVVAGFGIGATSPLRGIYADELFDRSRLGAAMGTISLVSGLSLALGPAMVGVLSDATGSRSWGVGVGVAAASAAVLLLRPARAAQGSRTGDAMTGRSA
jgi:predicted MFS family arabinose efflux permease